MIKAGMIKRDGGKVALLGITKENVRRLQMGDPINVDLTPLGVPGELVIIYGETLLQLQKTLAPLMGPNVKIEEGGGKGSMVKDYCFIKKGK